MFLSKGSHININRLIAVSTLINAALMVEEYLESVMLSINPQFDVFRDFIE